MPVKKLVKGCGQRTTHGQMDEAYQPNRVRIFYFFSFFFNSLKLCYNSSYKACGVHPAQFNTVDGV